MAGSIVIVKHNMGLKVMHVILTPGLIIGGWEWGMALTIDGISILQIRLL